MKPPLRQNPPSGPILHRLFSKLTSRQLLLMLSLFLTGELTVLLLRSSYNNFKFTPEPSSNPITENSSNSTSNLLSPISSPFVSFVQLPPASAKPKKVLLWTQFWKSTSLWSKVFHQTIYKECPISNCLFTTEKSEIDQADAVLFHLFDMPSNSPEDGEWPSRSNYQQLWILVTFEPPYVANYKELNLTRFNGIFNRTMTYRRDSDVVAIPGTFHPITESFSFKQPNYIGNWLNSRDSVADRNYAAGKDKLVAWFASARGCTSGSGREAYVEQLQKYVQVDIYGDCGPYKCGEKKNLRNHYSVEQDECYMLVSTNYKFYLAFENSICEDYVTEKLFNNLKLNVIPVVFGGANYGKIAPPHSVIDATRFTPQQLAQYIKVLDSNDTLYNEYFQWKSKYYVEAHDGMLMTCDLCAKLNDDVWTKQVKVYHQFDTWWQDKCYPPYRAEDEN